MLITPPPTDRRPRRFTQLLAGLVLYGVSDAMLLRAALGVDPWDVLHQGLSRSVGLGVGTWTNLVGVLVLVGWIPLRQRPGAGTVLNVLIIGTVVNATLASTPQLHGLPVRVVVLVAAIVLNGIATGLYIGAGLGPGPRDGIMTGIAGRGHSIRVVRTGIELAVLATGWLLGGNVGIGTLAYAVSIGPIVHWTLPAFLLRFDPRNRPELVDATPPAGSGPRDRDLPSASDPQRGPHDNTGATPTGHRAPRERADVLTSGVTAHRASPGGLAQPPTLGSSASTTHGS